MTAYCADTDANYQLKGGVANNNWQVITGSGGSDPGKLDKITFNLYTTPGRITKAKQSQFSTHVWSGINSKQAALNNYSCNSSAGYALVQLSNGQFYCKLLPPSSGGDVSSKLDVSAFISWTSQGGGRTTKNDLKLHNPGFTYTLSYNATNPIITDTNWHHRDPSQILRVNNKYHMWTSRVSSSKGYLCNSDRAFVHWSADNISGPWTQGDAVFFPTGNDGIYRTGTVAVTVGSNVVTGTGTSWTTAMIGLKFRIKCQQAEYTINTVNESTQTITLDSNYATATNDADMIGFVSGSSSAAEYEIKDDFTIGVDWDGYGIFNVEMFIAKNTSNIDTLYMTYQGTATSKLQYNASKMGLAVCDINNLDAPCTRMTPIFEGGGVGAWDWKIDGSNSPHHLSDGSWRMYYKGASYPTPGPQTMQIGIIIAPASNYFPTSPTAWTKYAGNPIWGNGVEGTPNSKTEDPHVILLNDIWYMLTSYTQPSGSGDTEYASWAKSLNGINGWISAPEIDSVAIDNIATITDSYSNGYCTGYLDGDLSYLTATIKNPNNDRLSQVLFNYIRTGDVPTIGTNLEGSESYTSYDSELSGNVIINDMGTNKSVPLGVTAPSIPYLGPNGLRMELGTVSDDRILRVSGDTTIKGGMIVAHGATGATGNGVSFVGWAHRNTLSSPHRTKNGDLLVSFAGKGYHAINDSDTAVINSFANGSLRILADGDHTSTSTGTTVDIRVTPNGSTSAISMLSINSSGITTHGTISDSIGALPSASSLSTAVSQASTAYTHSQSTGDAHSLLPANAVGALTNDGSGNLSWGSASIAYVASNYSAGNLNLAVSTFYDLYGTGISAVLPAPSSGIVGKHIYIRTGYGNNTLSSSILSKTSGYLYVNGSLVSSTIALSTTSGTVLDCICINSLAWSCSTSVPTGGGGSGTVTSITAGTGLTGGTITATGTIAVDTSTIATVASLSGYLTTSGTAADSDKLDGQHGSYYAPINSPSLAGYVGVGGTATAQLHTISSSTGNDKGVIVEQTTNGTTAPTVVFQKSRAGGVVSSGDAVGNLVYKAFVGATNTWQASANISATVDGSVSDATNGAPGRLVFQTSSGSASLERLRISSDGRFRISNQPSAPATNHAAATQGDLIFDTANGYIYMGISTGTDDGSTRRWRRIAYDVLW